MSYKEKNIGDIFRFVGYNKKWFNDFLISIKRGKLVLICEKKIIGYNKNGDEKICLTILIDNKFFNIKNKCFDEFFDKVT